MSPVCDFYDLSPSGYFYFTKDGKVLELNSSAASLLEKNVKQ